MSALGFSNAVIGVFNALPAVGVLLVGVPAGALADRLGYRAFILAASVASLVGAVGLSATGQKLLAVGAAGLYALGVTVVSLLSVPMLAQLSGSGERVALYAVNQSLGWIASLIGYLLGGYLPEIMRHSASAAGAPALRTAFLGMTVLQAASLPFVLRLSTAPGPRPSQAFPLRLLIQVDWGRFTRLLVPQALLGTGAGMLLNFIQLYLAQRFGLSPGPIGLVLAGAALLTALVVLASPAASRAFGMARTIGLAQVLGAPLVVGLAFIQSLPLALGVLYLRQSVLNLQSPLSQVFGMEFVEARERARLATAENVVFSLGFGGLGPLISGVLQVRGGYQLAFSVSAALYLAAGLTFLGFFAGLRLPSESPKSPTGR